ncbi:MAG: hypothetical protein MUO51_08955 [Woeseiaceae bacterium]|nr:hypothetical protein [Woeseiaceae bacterium]
MNTRYLMSLSAAFLAMLGVGITFLPQELIAYVGAPSDGTVVLLMQMLGALYLGFAMLNWMNREGHIGGIYRRPVSMANFLNFVIGGAALVKWVIAEQFAFEVAAMALIYSVFGVWFGLVLFTHPDNETQSRSDR